MSTFPIPASFSRLLFLVFLLNAPLFSQEAPKPSPPSLAHLQLPPDLAATIDEQAKSRRYLDIARSLGEAAKTLEHPYMIRAYTTFVIDFHTRQLTWTVFFAKNLLPGESVYQMRLNTNTIVPNANEAPLEQELGKLLKAARKKFPNNLHIEFASAYFFHKGRRALIKPPFSYSPQEVFQIYENAWEQKIYTPDSLVFIALNRQERGKDIDTVGNLLRRAYHDNQTNPMVLEALLNLLLKEKSFKQALTVSNQLFTGAVTPEQKLAGYTGAARSFFHLEQYESTLKAVENGLKLAPNHTLLWAVGLDTLRKQKRWDDYEKLLRQVLDRRAESPAPFLDYLDYLRLRGVTPQDDAFVKAYSQERGGSDIARITRHTNAGNFHLILFGDGPAALKQFKKAKKISKTLKNPPPDMAKVLDEFIETAKNTKPLEQAPKKKE